MDGKTFRIGWGMTWLVQSPLAVLSAVTLAPGALAWSDDVVAFLAITLLAGIAGVLAGAWLLASAAGASGRQASTGAWSAAVAAQVVFLALTGWVVASELDMLLNGPKAPSP